MYSAEWIKLLEKIPADAEDGLGLVMSNGVEMTVTTIICTDEHFVVIKGRAVGSTDAGRTYFVPFDQITYMVYNRVVKEDVIQAWFDPEAAPAVAPAEEVTEEAAPAAAAAETPPEPAAPAAPATPGPAPARPSLPGAPKPAAAAAVKPIAAAPAKPAPAVAPGRPSLPLRPPGAPKPAATPAAAAANLQNNPIKSALLDRLRARRAAGDAPESPPPPSDKK